MQKRIILSLVIITAVGSLGYLAARAFFTDTETGTGSEFTMGTLDLDIDGANGTEVDPFVIQNIGAEGDISGGKIWTVNNTGSLPGRLYFKLNSVVNNDNGCNEPEALADATCGNPGAGQGELGNVITVEVLLDGVLVATSDLATANQDLIGTTWNALDPVVIPAGESKQVMMQWATGQDAYGNEIQSDSLTFATVFDLVQIISEEPAP